MSNISNSTITVGGNLTIGNTISDQDWAEKARLALLDGEIQAAIDCFPSHFTKITDVYQQSGRMKQNERMYNQGRVGVTEYTIERNRIFEAVSSLLPPAPKVIVEHHSAHEPFFIGADAARAIIAQHDAERLTPLKKLNEAEETISRNLKDDTVLSSGMLAALTTIIDLSEEKDLAEMLDIVSGIKFQRKLQSEREEIITELANEVLTKVEGLRAELKEVKKENAGWKEVWNHLNEHPSQTSFDAAMTAIKERLKSAVFSKQQRTEFTKLSADVQIKSLWVMRWPKQQDLIQWVNGNLK